ncbi:MAG: UPF0104 family protein [Nitrospiraceae bacterium]|nr:MAG: UPF0104 family protein [Nitrospiraceae bacterium]
MHKRLISALFLVGIAAAGIIYYFRHKEDFYLLTSVSVSAVVALSFVFVLITLLYGLQLKILMDHYKLGIGFFQCFGISRASSFINLFLPFAVSASFKAVYLNKLLQFRYSSFIASMGMTTIIKIMLYAFISLLFLIVSDVDVNMFLFGVSSLIFSASLLFLALGHKLKKLDVTASKHFLNIIDEWQKIRVDYRTIRRLIYVSLFLFLSAALNTYLSFRAFSVNISANASGTIAAFTTITGLLNLIPGNLGIREAIIILISKSHGVGINESVHAAALGRLLQIIWTLILASFFRYNLSNKKR